MENSECLIKKVAWCGNTGNHVRVCCRRYERSFNHVRIVLWRTQGLKKRYLYYRLHSHTVRSRFYSQTPPGCEFGPHFQFKKTSHAYLKMKQVFSDLLNVGFFSITHSKNSPSKRSSLKSKFRCKNGGQTVNPRIHIAHPYENFYNISTVAVYHNKLLLYKTSFPH